MTLRAILHRRHRAVQRKADESLAAAALGYRPSRLGIDVAPRRRPGESTRAREEGGLR